MPAFPAAQFTPFTAKAADAVIIASGVAKLVGWTLTETTGSATASAAFYDCTTTGAIGSSNSYGTITLAANESIRDSFGELGILNATGGITLHVLSGSVSGTVFWE